MSAAAELQAALVAALGAADGIAGVATGVWDGAPARPAFPYLVLGEGQSLDWSTKTAAGREHRVTVTAWDRAGEAARLHALAAAAEAAVDGLPPDLPGHWIASVAFVRTRHARPAAGPWGAQVEYRIRTMARG